MSEHSVNIIEVREILPHGNADRLEIIPVGGWQAVVKKGDFSIGDKAIYIEPDYTVPTQSDLFSFLAREGRDRHRLKAVRLRGILSYGLLVPVPEDLSSRPVGSDVMTDLGIERYEPPVKMAHNDMLSEDRWPRIYSPKFDVENIQKYEALFEDSENVIVTEKIHGANARYLFNDGIFFIGSRTQWLKQDANHLWKKAADSDPRIESWCRAHPDHVLYGEIYGAVQSLKYGCGIGEVRFASFAVLSKGEWLNTDNLLNDESILSVPMIYRGPFKREIFDLAEEDSSVPGAETGHIREGIVIVPEIERRDEKIGRLILKYVSNRYWESNA